MGPNLGNFSGAPAHASGHWDAPSETPSPGPRQPSEPATPEPTPGAAPNAPGPDDAAVDPSADSNAPASTEHAAPDPTPLYDAPPQQDASHVQHAWPSSPAGPRLYGKERDYLLSILLVIVTLGIYHFYYHYKAHDELCQQLGRRNDNNTLFVFYVVAVVVGSFAAPLGVIGLVLLIFIVINQYKLIKEARHRLGLPERGDAVWFLLWDTLGVFILVGPFIAYYNMINNYNDVWRALRQGTPLAAESPAPGAAPAYSTPAASWGAQAPAWDTGATQSPPVGQETTGGFGIQTTPGGPDTARAADSFSVRTRQAGAGSASYPGHAGAAQTVDQTFRCPRCHEHVIARGQSGTQVSVECAACGEVGQVLLDAQ